MSLNTLRLARSAQSVPWSPLRSSGLRPFRAEWANRSGATVRPLRLEHLGGDPCPDRWPRWMPPVGSSRLRAPVQGLASIAAARARDETGRSAKDMIEWFVGVDWGSEAHQVCIIDGEGSVRGEHSFTHTGSGLAEMAAWLLAQARAAADVIGVAIEVPHGPVVEALMEHGFVVHSLNPKQLDRFRDRLARRRQGRPSRRPRARRCVADRPPLLPVLFGAWVARRSAR